MRWRGLATAIAVLALATPAGTAVAYAGGATAGSPGLGDELFPALGNGGYDVAHYALRLNYPTAKAAVVRGEVVIFARPTQHLSRFNLDFAGGSVRSVTVNRAPAAWSRYDEELVVSPSRSLHRGRLFVVRVRFEAGPTELPENPGFELIPWFFTADGSATAAQPNGAHFIFPSNDHPRDKASYDFRLTVPAGTTAVANGVLTGRQTRYGRTEWRYLQRQPMASELIQLAVGDLDVQPRGSAGGVPLRDVSARTLTPKLGPVFARTGDHMRWLEDRLGPYPFDVYGNLVVEANLFFALETQTLSLFGPIFFFDPERAGELRPPEAWEPIMVHELAHQWLGNSVSPEQWVDVWLNEGHATWYEFEYADDRGWVDLDEVMRNIYADSDQLRADFGPVGRPRSGAIEDLFNPHVYVGGALVLYALRQEVGDATFRRIERTWVDRYRNSVVGTDDFVAHASRIAGRDLGPFLRPWIYDTTTPPMPGHPDWTVKPVQAQPAVPAP